MDDATRMRLIGERAAALVPDGATIGLGTGATADAMIDALGDLVRSGLQVTGVATSSRTIDRANDRGIPLITLDEAGELAICIDGADEIDPDLSLVKVRGGALLFEKLVARSANRLVIIGSSEKLVDRLGTRLPLPVEIVPFGASHTTREIAALGLEPILRTTDDGSPFVSDGGHWIVDCESDGIDDAAQLAHDLKQITGVVEHGLFVGMCDLALTVDAEGMIAEHVRR
ncbi:MAG TPA: ribose-5-phosphate isomerase RpiA [Thermomicrobiales bacterium]|nr:ribose-5-phosphate isomerase RpiA [Thermomicrobiales bacterium]